MSGLLPTAITRGDVADFFEAFLLIYVILIFAWIVMSWVISLRGSLPYITPLRVVTDFIDQTVTPYLSLWRKVIPPIGGGRMAIDLSPMVGTIFLLIVGGIVAGLIRG